MWRFRFFEHWCSLQKVGLFALDAVALALGFVLGGALAGWRLDVSNIAGLWTPALVFAACQQLWLYLVDLYDLDDARFFARVRARLPAAMGLGLGSFAIAAVWLVESTPAAELIFGAVTSALCLLASRAAFRRSCGHPARLLVVGDSARAEKFCRLIQGHHQFARVAALDWREVPRYLAGSGPETGEGSALRPILAASPLEDALLNAAARQAVNEASADSPLTRPLTRARDAFPRPPFAAADSRQDAIRPDFAFDLVVLCADATSRAPSARTLLDLKLAGIPVFEAASFLERTFRRLPVELLSAEDLVFARGFAQGRVDRFLKRALDIAASAILLVVALPILALAAICIRLDSRGPIFYRQERVGQGGRTFWLTKLRTMRVDAEKEGEPQWAREGDSRVTRVGRWLRKCRIDELPQIFSVLRGEMSFVGPRPERAYFVERLERQIPFYRLRLIARPGITGWAQVRYPYGASVEDARAKLEYDLYYLKNRTLFLDLSVIFHTVRHVVMGKGAR